MSLSDVTIEAVVEILVDRLTSVAVQIRSLADGLDEKKADHARWLAELLDWTARDAAVVNMQWEDQKEPAKQT